MSWLALRIEDLDRIPCRTGDSGTGMFLYKISRALFFLQWDDLREIGNLKFLKATYLVLALVPFLTRHEEITQFFGIPRWYLATIFFGSVFLAVATLIYDIRCPVIVKRFASTGDLYRDMLEIKLLSLQAYPTDDYKAQLDHCTENYRSESQARPLSRFLCSTLYNASGLLFAIIFGYRSYLVARFFLESN